ncbi:MAG: RecB family exonuclease, partial [Actinomycetes bacterium]
FLNNFFDEKPKHISGFLQKNLSLNSIVTNLRRLAENENGQTEFKKALAQRLYKINQTKDIFNRPVSANSNPHNWWATFSSNDDFYEIIKEKSFIKLSASSLATLRDCSLKWFLERKAGATLLRQNSASIGSIIHAIAQGLTNEEIDPNLESLKKELDKVWYQLNFESEWLNKREYENTLEILQNLLSWHLKRNDKKVLGAEVYFNFEIYFEEIDATAQVSGFIDRLEADIDEISNIHIIDFKTSKNNLTKNEAGQDPQLGIYRLAVQEKSIKLELAENAVDKSADLVYLRLQNKSGVIERESYDVEQSNIKETIKNALLVIKDQNYKATPNPMCRTCNFKRMCPAQPEGRGVIE